MLTWTLSLKNYSDGSNFSPVLNFGALCPLEEHFNQFPWSFELLRTHVHTGLLYSINGFQLWVSLFLNQIKSAKRLQAEVLVRLMWHLHPGIIFIPEENKSFLIHKWNLYFCRLPKAGHKELWRATTFSSCLKHTYKGLLVLRCLLQTWTWHINRALK